MLPVSGKGRVALATVLAAAAVAWGWLLWATPHGIGLSPDSVNYVHTDPFRPTHHHNPPLYPLCLKTLRVFSGLAPLPNARLASLIFFASNVALTGALLFLATGCLRVALLGQVVFLLSPAMLSVHTMAWSEPPFLLCSSALAMALARARLGPATLLAALALLTRYAGGAWLLTGLFFFRGRARLVFLVGACLPLGAWLALPVPDSLRPEWNATPHPPLSMCLDYAANTLRLWVPVRALGWRVLVVAAGAAWLLRPRPASAPACPDLARVWSVFVLAYAGFIAVAPVIPDLRITAPLWWGLLHLALTRRWWPFQAAAFTLACLTLSSAVTLMQKSHDEGLAYAGSGWSGSLLVREVRRLPADALIFSNDPNPFTLYSDRQVRWLAPPRLDLGAPDPSFPLRLSKMQEECRNRGGGYYVVVGPPDPEMVVPSHWEMRKNSIEGRIFRVPVEDIPSDKEKGSKGGLHSWTLRTIAWESPRSRQTEFSCGPTAPFAPCSATPRRSSRPCASAT